MPDVPTQTFPVITSATAAWLSSGYTLVDLSTATGATLCAKARDWIKNRWSTSGITNALIRIDTTCTFQNSNNDVFSSRASRDPSDGGFNLTQQSTWNGTAGSIKHIHFISVYSTTCSGSTKDVSVSNNTNFNSFTEVFFYTPCRATMSNQNAFKGQVMSKDITIGTTSRCPTSPSWSRHHRRDRLQAGHLVHPRVTRPPPPPRPRGVGSGPWTTA